MARTAPYPICPYCGSGLMVQTEWDDDCYGEQNEINRSEKWVCSDCGKTTFMHVHYKMDWYAPDLNAQDILDINWEDENEVRIQEEE